MNEELANPFSTTLAEATRPEPQDDGSAFAAPSATPGQPKKDPWDAAYDRLKLQQKLTRANQLDKEIRDYITSPDNRWDETTWQRLDQWSKDRLGFETVHGDALNGHDLKPFPSSQEYARTVLDVIQRGYEAYTTPDYTEALKAKAQGDDALDAYLGVEHKKVVGNEAGFGMSPAQSITGATFQQTVDRTPEEIKAEREEKFGKIMSKNFIALHNLFDEKFDFTPDEEYVIQSAVRSRDGLKDEKAKHIFEHLVLDELEKTGGVERAANVLELIRHTKKDAYAWHKDAFFEVAESWKGTVRPYMDFWSGVGERVGSEFGAQAEMPASAQSGLYYWNDAEKAEYARLKSLYDETTRSYPSMAVPGNFPQMPDPATRVNQLCAARLSREAIPEEEQKARRRAELMLEEATKHAPVDHGIIYNGLVGTLSTIPYMAISALGAPGFAQIAINQFQNVRDQITLGGGDPDEAIGTQLLLAVGWAGIERLELAGLFGKPMTQIGKRAVLMNVVNTSWKSGKLKALGAAARTMAPEAAISLAAENTEEGLQGAVEKGSATYFTTHDWKKTLDEASKQFAEDFVSSTPTMVPLVSLGMVGKYRHAKRYAYDYDSLKDFSEKYIRSVNIFRGTLAAPEAASAASAEDAQLKAKAANEMFFDCAEIWNRHIADKTGGVAAMDEIREKYSLTDEQTRTVADALDLRQNLGEIAGADYGAENAIMQTVGGAFRIGNDTTYNPADLMRAINPNITAEVVDMPLPGGKPSAEMQAAMDEATAARQRVNDAKVGSERRAAERQLRKASKKVKAIREKGGEFATAKRLKVTIPFGDTTRSYYIEHNYEGADIHSEGYAISVADEMKKLVGQPVEKGSRETFADGSAISLEEFKALPPESKLGVAVTQEQYMKMTPEEREQYVFANNLQSGGYFRVLDEHEREVTGSQGLVEMMRAFGKIGTAPGGNWTLAHEHGHAVERFAAAIGAIKTDSKSVAVMRRLFGNPTADNELWNTEASSNAFADYLRNKYDFKRLTPEERREARGFFRNLWDTVRGIFAASGREAPVPPVVKAERDRAIDAAMNAIANGDFSGLDAFADKDIGDVNSTNKGSAAENAPKTPSKPSDAKPVDQPLPNVRRDPAAPKPPKAPKQPKANVPDDNNAAFQAGFEAALAQISADPEHFAAQQPVRTGTKRTVFTPGYEMAIEADAMWVPLASLVESTDDREVQMRDRSRMATDQQVLSKTRKGVFQPLALFPGTKSDDGAPIVGNGLRIISGHGRKRMLDQLAREGRFAEYLSAVNAEAARQGMPAAPEGMENPVLVLRVTGGLDKREDLTRFAELSNRWGGLERSGAEHAESDARKITDALLRLYSPDASVNLLAASNRPFMSAFLKEVGATGLTNADGTPTAEAALRVQRAMMTAIFGSDDKVRAMVQNLLERNQELSLATLQNALLKSAGRLLAMKRQRGSFDIVSDVREAAYQYIAWRSAQAKNPRLTLADHLNQSDFFTAAVPTMQQAIAKLLEAGRFGATLDKYAELVAQQEIDAQATFAGMFEKRTPLQLLCYAERAMLPLKEGVTEAKSDADYANPPVTPDPASPEAAEPVQTPPAEPAPAPTSSATASPIDAAQSILAPPEPTTFKPVPVKRGTATLPGPGAKGIDGYQVNADGQPIGDKRQLPPGAWNLTRDPFAPKHPPAPSQQDLAGRGLGIGQPQTTTHNDIFPRFQGYKKDMADRTSQALHHTMPKAEREHYETVVDYFGGGGCWGLYLALENFPNAKLLVINEFDPDRLEKIRLLQELDGAVSDEARKILYDTGTYDRVRNMKTSSPSTIRNFIEGALLEGKDENASLFGDSIKMLSDPYERAIIRAFCDCAQQLLGSAKDESGNKGTPEVGVEKALAQLKEDGEKAKAAADEFKARGGRIAYRAGDAASFDDAPKGDKVVAVCDPPYYLTSDYKTGKILGLKRVPDNWSYEATQDLLHKLVDSGDAIVYTDEAWWHKKTYSPDTADFAREQEILLDIINTFDHFDVAGRVGASTHPRQETLGIHHGHKIDEGTAGGTDSDVAEHAGNDDAGGIGGARHSVRRVARVAEGESRLLRGAGARRGREGRAALAREVIVQDIAANLGESPSADSIARHSVRLVREERMANDAEYRAVYERFHRPDGSALAGWLKAPNGQPSKLDPVQYVQVRTPSFKAWFGDWENEAARQFLETEVVATANGDEYAGLGRKEITNAVFENWQRVGGHVTNLQVGDIQLSKSGIHDSLAHGMGRAKIAAFNLVPEILSQGRVVRFRPNWEGRGYDSHVIAAPVIIGGKRHVALAIVNSNKGGNRFYLHEVGLLDEIKKNAEAFRTGSSGETPALSRNLGDVGSIALSLFTDKGVSKVVDENGEPLVVYHGSGTRDEMYYLEDERPFFTTTDKSVADKFGGYNQKYALYGRIQNPLVIDAKGRHWDDVTVPDSVRAAFLEGISDVDGEISGTTNDIAYAARLSGYDGVIVKNVQEGWGDHPVDDYIFLKADGNVKRADEITYDYYGNEIPLSERFSHSSDIRFSVRVSREEYAKVASLVSENDARAYRAGTEPLPCGIAHTYDWGYAYDRFSDGTFAITARWNLNGKNGILYWQKEKEFEDELNEAAARARENHEDVWLGLRGDDDGVLGSADEVATGVDAALDGQRLRQDGQLPGQGDDLQGASNRAGLGTGLNGRPVARHSLRVNPHLRDDVEAMYLGRRSGGKKVVRHERLTFSSMPDLLVQLGLPDVNIESDRARVMKIVSKHGLTYDQVADLPNRYDKPVAVFKDGDSAYVIMTDMMAKTDAGAMKPVMVRLTEKVGANGESVFVASAYPREADKESEYVRLVNTTGAALYFDESKVAALGLEEGTTSTLCTLTSRDDVMTPEDYSSLVTPRSIPNSPAAVQPRHSMRSGTPMRREDIAVAMLAARRLAGKDVPTEDADRMLKNMGVTASASDVLAKANALADSNREKLKAGVERSEPAIFAALARENMADRYRNALSSAITGGAALADPALGAKVQQAIQSKQVRDLMNANGFDAAQMMAELPVDLAQAVFAVAEYEKSPEELARLEAARKKREEERAAEEFDEDEAAERIDDPAYREPTDEERAKLDALLDRARFMEEARKAEEDRKKLEKKKSGEEGSAGDAPSSPDGEGGDGEGTDPGFGLPVETVRRIAPVFESADLFASFIVEWTADHVAEKHPNIPSTAEMWKNPVAVRELKQTATHILRKLAKDVLGSPSLNYARNFADHAINELESDAECKTFNAVRRKIARIYDQIHDHALSLSRRKMVNNLVKEIKKAAIEHGRFSAIKEDLKRKIDAKTEQWCRWLVPALTMSEEKLTDEINRLTALVTVDPADEHATPEDKLREAADRLAVLQKYGGMSRWMPGKIADAEAEIMQMINGKRADFEARREEALAKDEALRKAIINAVESGAPAAYRKHTKLGDKIGKYTSAMMGNLTLEMQHLIRYCTDPSLRQAALEAIEEMQTWISEGGSTYRTVLGQAQAELHEGLAAAYGNAEAGIKHLLRDEIPEEAANAIFTQGKDRVPTYGQLLQLYASTIQSDYKENAEKHGRTATLPLMEATLTDADKKFHAWAVEWFKRNRKALSDSVEAVTGLPVTSPDALYTPVRILREKTGFDAEGMGWSPVPSALNRRIAHDLDFNEGVNFLACLQEQAEVRAQTIGYAEIGIRLRDTIAHRDVQSAVRKNVGKADMKIVTDHVRDVLVQNAVRKDETAFWAPLNAARRWMARFYLSGNTPSALKQLASMPVWANALLGGKEVGLTRCMHYLTTVGTDEGRTALRELMASDGFKARYTMGWSEETQNVLTNPSKNRILRYIERAYDKGMVVNKAVDGVSCLWMAQGFYRDATQSFVDRGLPLDEAKQKAMALTWSVLESGQQSGRVENLNALQRRGGAGVASIFQFKTAYLLQNNYLIQAMREMRAGTPGARGRFLRALFINTVWIPAFVACVNAAWSAIMGDEPPEDEEKWPLWFKTLCWSMIDGVTAPMFGLDSALHTAYDAMTNTKNWRTDSEIPALSGAIRVSRDAARVIYDLGKYGLQSFDAFDFEEELTGEKLGKDVNRLVKDILAPYRHASKAIENRFGDE